MDPVELRLMNEPEIDEGHGVPFSSRHFQECLTLGAEKFGWAGRDPRVGSMRRDGVTLGWGVAACSWLAARFDCSASVELRDDGTARVASASQDIGTGTYTVLAQMVAERSGSRAIGSRCSGRYHAAAGSASGGSMLTASFVAPIPTAIEEARPRASATEGSMADSATARNAEDLEFSRGRVSDRAQCATDDVRRGAQGGEARAGLGPGSGQGTFRRKEKPKLSSHSFGAHFVEVTWRPEIARLRVPRVVSVIDAGRIINPLLARNQIEAPWRWASAWRCSRAPNTTRATGRR